MAGDKPPGGSGGGGGGTGPSPGESGPKQPANDNAAPRQAANDNAAPKQAANDNAQQRPAQQGDAGRRGAQEQPKAADTAQQREESAGAGGGSGQSRVPGEAGAPSGGGGRQSGDAPSAPSQEAGTDARAAQSQPEAVPAAAPRGQEPGKDVKAGPRGTEPDAADSGDSTTKQGTPGRSDLTAGVAARHDGRSSGGTTEAPQREAAEPDRETKGRGDASASDRAASDRAASDRAASDRAASDRAASDRAASGANSTPERTPGTTGQVGSGETARDAAAADGRRDGRGTAGGEDRAGKGDPSGRPGDGKGGDEPKPRGAPGDHQESGLRPNGGTAAPGTDAAALATTGAEPLESATRTDAATGAATVDPKAEARLAAGARTVDAENARLQASNSSDQKAKTSVGAASHDLDAEADRLAAAKGRTETSRSGTGTEARPTVPGEKGAPPPSARTDGPATEAGGESARAATDAANATRSGAQEVPNDKPAAQPGPTPPEARPAAANDNLRPQDRDAFSRLSDEQKAECCAQHEKAVMDALEARRNDPRTRDMFPPDFDPKAGAATWEDAIRRDYMNVRPKTDADGRTTYEMTPRYPDHGGVDRSAEQRVDHQFFGGDRLDRIGPEYNGKFMAVQSTADVPAHQPTFEERGLPSGHVGAEYKDYEVTKPFTADMTRVAPAFDRPGGAWQIDLKTARVEGSPGPGLTPGPEPRPITVEWLRQNQYIKEAGT